LHALLLTTVNFGLSVPLVPLLLFVLLFCTEGLPSLTFVLASVLLIGCTSQSGQRLLSFLVLLLFSLDTFFSSAGILYLITLVTLLNLLAVGTLASLAFIYLYTSMF
jgi:hypothetical protein